MIELVLILASLIFIVSLICLYYLKKIWKLTRANTIIHNNKTFYVPRQNKIINGLLFKPTGGLLIYILLLLIPVLYYMNLGQVQQCNVIPLGNYTISGTNTTKIISNNELNCTLNFGAIGIGFAILALSITLLIDWVYRGNIELGKFDNVANLTNSKITKLSYVLLELEKLLEKEEYSTMHYILNTFQFSSLIYELENDRKIIDRLISIQNKIDELNIQIERLNQLSKKDIENKNQYTINAQRYLGELKCLISISGVDKKP